MTNATGLLESDERRPRTRERRETQSVRVPALRTIGTIAIGFALATAPLLLAGEDGLAWASGALSLALGGVFSVVARSGPRAST